MKKIGLILSITGCVIISIALGFLVSNKMHNVKEVCNNSFYYVGSTIPITTDSIEYTIEYAWTIDGPSTETQRLQVNTAVQYIIQKHFNKYSSKEVNNKSTYIISDITERIEDSVFMIFPIEFTLEEIVIK